MNNRFHQIIVSEISKKQFFSQSDFTIEYLADNLVVKYKFTNLSNEFKSSLPTEKKVISNNGKEQLSYVFKGFMKPGRFSSNESFISYSEHELLTNLREWLMFLEEELIGYATIQRFKKHEDRMHIIEKQLEEYLSQSDNHQDYISTFELEQINIKMDLIYDEISESISSLKIHKEEAEKELASIKKEIEQLKSSANYLNKKQWISKFTLTIGEWMTNPEKIKRIKLGATIVDNIATVIGLPKTNITALLPEKIEN